MIRYLIQRPIAVIMTFIVLVVTGLVLVKKVPVSLLPDVDVPKIAIRINYPNTAAPMLEQNIVSIIREGLANTNNIQEIESQSFNHTGVIYITFDFGTKMELAYIEVNERLDRLSNVLPKDMDRPQVMRLNTSDIPIIRIQVVPKKQTNYLDVSALAEKVLKRRLEQLDGVSLVDINGKQQSTLFIKPKKNELAAMGISERDIIEAIQSANRELSGLSVADGQLRYFVKVQNVLESLSAIATLPIKLRNGTIVTLNEIAEIEKSPDRQTGYHIYNGNEGIVITVQKQPGSRMNELVPQIKKAITLFQKDYPQVDFALTQDQTYLLDAGIDNLMQDLVCGSVLTILLLFMFLGHWTSPLLMGISIPISLIITFLFFYFFNISFNIISLSGLALGVGMLIDNSIVVVDSITRKRRIGMNELDSSVFGTNEVMVTVISQVLTTVAVYAPLILLTGMAGSLIFDQAIGLTISLAASLLVSFLLVPLLYKMLRKVSNEKLKEDTVLYKYLSIGYHKMICHIMRRKLLYLIITILLMPVGILIAQKIPISALPAIEKKESLVSIDWNAPIDAQENLRRTKDLLAVVQSNCVATEAEVGIKQFLLQQEQNTMQQTEIYYACKNERIKLKTDGQLKQWIQMRYPRALIKIMDAPNAFTQLFNNAAPYLEARFKPIENMNDGDLLAGIEKIARNGLGNYTYSLGANLVVEPSINVLLNYPKMAIYGIARATIEEALRQQFGIYTVSEIKRFGDITSIRLKADQNTIERKLEDKVAGANGIMYPLKHFLSFENSLQSKSVSADRTGEYKSIRIDEKADDIPLLENRLSSLALKHGFNVYFTGKYYESRQQLDELWTIFIVSLLLLYFILAIQYNNLIQPLIVMLTIPLGITGGMLLLWLTGGTLDVMAVIGFIVILGLIVDDPILKVDTLNRLEKEYVSQGLRHDTKLLERMIHEAGEICLKPLLMVSLTTSIALLPVLFIGGIGNDLQKPLAIVIIGGLTMGTFFTTWFIPLAYWYITKWRRRI